MSTVGSAPKALSAPVKRYLFFLSYRENEKYSTFSQCAVRTLLLPAAPFPRKSPAARNARRVICGERSGRSAARPPNPRSSILRRAGFAANTLENKDFVFKQRALRAAHGACALAAESAGNRRKRFLRGILYRTSKSTSFRVCRWARRSDRTFPKALQNFEGVPRTYSESSRAGR